MIKKKPQRQAEQLDVRGQGTASAVGGMLGLARVVVQQTIAAKRAGVCGEPSRQNVTRAQAQA